MFNLVIIFSMKSFANKKPRIFARFICKRTKLSLHYDLFFITRVIWIFILTQKCGNSIDLFFKSPPLIRGIWVGNRQTLNKKCLIFGPPECSILQLWIPTEPPQQGPCINYVDKKGPDEKLVSIIWIYLL